MVGARQQRAHLTPVRLEHTSSQKVLLARDTRTYAYPVLHECVGILTAASTPSASSTRHKLVTVFVCV